MKATKAQILAAAKAFCERNPENTISESDNGHIRLFEGSPKPGDIELWEENGELRCSNPDFGMIFSEYIHDIEKPPVQTQQQSPSTSLVTPEEHKKIAEIKGQKKAAGSAVETWQKKQERTYFANGKEVPNAFAASEEANRRKINTETDSGRSDILAWGKARAIDAETGQYRESKVNFDFRTFRQRTSWEIAKNLEKKLKGGVIIGVDEQTLLPILDGSKTFKDIPLPLYVHMQVLDRWTFADRDAESKAERRAILKLCNREWRDKEEIESERQEERAVQEARA